MRWKRGSVVVTSATGADGLASVRFRKGRGVRGWESGKLVSRPDALVHRCGFHARCRCHLGGGVDRPFDRRAESRRMCDDCGTLNAWDLPHAKLVPIRIW
jgi:hypothetical protein